MALNRWEGIGNVGGEPDIKQNGELKIASFSLAVNEKFKGETTTQWFRVAAFGKLADIIESYVHKGSKVFVDGRIVLNEWTGQDGTKHNGFSVYVANIQLLDNRPVEVTETAAPAPTAKAATKGIKVPAPADLEGF